MPSRPPPSKHRPKPASAPAPEPKQTPAPKPTPASKPKPTPAPVSSPKPPPAPSRKRRPAARPGEITRAALELFSERGFSATRLEDVAARAGLSKAAIYLYFEDKTALLKAVIHEAVDATAARAQGIVVGQTGPVAPLLEAMLASVATGMRHGPLPDVVKLVISESRAHPEIGRFYYESVIGRMLPVVEGLIKRGIATGEFRAVDPRLAVKSLVAPMLLAALWRSVFEPIGAPHLDVEALAAQHAQIITRGLAPAPAPDATE